MRRWNVQNTRVKSSKNFVLRCPFVWIDQKHPTASSPFQQFLSSLESATQSHNILIVFGCSNVQCKFWECNARAERLSSLRLTECRTGKSTLIEESLNHLTWDSWLPCFSMRAATFARVYKTAPHCGPRTDRKRMAARQTYIPWVFEEWNQLFYQGHTLILFLTFPSITKYYTRRE